MSSLTLDLEAFFKDYMPPTPAAHEPKRKVLAAAFDGEHIDFDALIYIMVLSWRSCATAPRLAAVARSWMKATKEAETIVRCEDVPVPRNRITQYKLPPVEPTLSLAEQAVRASWGGDFGSYGYFNCEGQISRLYPRRNAPAQRR